MNVQVTHVNMEERVTTTLVYITVHVHMGIPTTTVKQESITVAKQKAI